MTDPHDRVQAVQSSRPKPQPLRQTDRADAEQPQSDASRSP
ncbi:hypothetical protein QFZ75_007640 [Streptomyces sp. V3I8]|nr:hypothetical protein [Streptomyces sp. V3I8]MDQ1041224.1 hypothetical protein [Streptomyces sp. V3I8]